MKKVVTTVIAVRTHRYAAIGIQAWMAPPDAAATDAVQAMIAAQAAPPRKRDPQKAVAAMAATALWMGTRGDWGAAAPEE